MAATEARAAWQRMANRCFVQEDAKRAPKLASCPSSSSSSKQQSDVGPVDGATESEHPTAGFVPLNWNPSNSKLPPETKWWLHLQPNVSCQKDLSYEQLSALEAELGDLKAGVINQTNNLSGEPQPNLEEITNDDKKKNTGSSMGLQCRVLPSSMKHDPAVATHELMTLKSNKTHESCVVLPSCMEHDPGVAAHEVKTLNSSKTHKSLKHKCMEEFWYQDDLIDLDTVSCLSSKHSENLLFDWGSPWMGAEKTEPWWRTADKDELASLVAQKSLEHIENCDLPRPHATHVRRSAFTCLTDHGQGSYSWNTPTSGNMVGLQLALGEVEHTPHGTDRSFSPENQSAVNKNFIETQHAKENNPSKAQLLEALRHSQTRAREAEKAAQQAYTEKEHIIKLFFRQASHLFAYRQWFQILQMETLCLQLKNKDQPISTLFPVGLPWMPNKNRQQKNRKHKATKEKKNAQRFDINRYAVAFAVGFSLAGAGLLLGWTIGWLLPAI